MGSGDERRLREVAAEVTARAGYDLEELAVRSAGRRRVVRVVIDGDGGVTLDAAADVSRAISERLDADGDADPAGSLPYTLEVTSPGIGRPLTLPRHFRRARTRLVALVAKDGRAVTGHLLAADDESVTLLVSSRKGMSEVEIGYSDIERAKVEVEFSAPSAAVLARLGVEPAAESTDDNLDDEIESDDDTDDEFESDDDTDDDDTDDDDTEHDEADDAIDDDDADDNDDDDAIDDDADQTDDEPSAELGDAKQG